MWKLSLLVLVHGILSTVHAGQECVLETLKCSRHRIQIIPHKDLRETPEALDEMCRQQEYFYSCLEKMVPSHCPESELALPTELQVARHLTRDLCEEGSDWRKRYLQAAACINRQLAAEACTSSNFFAGIMSRHKAPLNRCHLHGAAVSCISALLMLNCGTDAGNVFNHLLRISSPDNEDCDILGSEVIRTFLGDEDTKAGTEVDIYTTLLKRIGDIPDQEDAHDSQFVLLDRVGDSVDLGNVYGTNKLEEYLSDTWSDDSVEDVGNVESVSEAIKSTDALEENFKPEFSDINSDGRATVTYEIPLYPDMNEVLLKLKDIPDTVVPEFIKDPVFLDHPDGRILFYWKSEKYPIESLKCNHGDSFFCYYERRFKDPQCLENNTFESESSINPYEIDPEFGVERYKSKEVIFYTFYQFMKFELPEYNPSQTFVGDEGSGIDSSEGESSSQSSQSTHHSGYEQTESFAEVSNESTRGFDILEDSTTERDLSEENLNSVLPSESTTLEQLIKVLATASQPDPEDATLRDIWDDGPMSVKKESLDSSTSESDFRTEVTTLNELLEAFTSASPHKADERNSSLLRQMVRDEWNKLFLDGNPTGVRLNDGVFFFWPKNNLSPIESVRCQRVNECHPKGKDVMKCSITPRNVVPY